MSKFFKIFSIRNLQQKGQGIVEYALILAFVVGLAAYLTNANGIGTAVQTTFNNVTNALTTANNNSQSTTGGNGTTGGE
ncbi:MAG: hypothetical protein II778_05815 [Anaerovibrio sp.]|uniref:Flp family type IVb pilin n=1 Tax=uncultured Anaerovibrio sp. TaxID=361586 RepID=UPI0025E3B267|nr:hypothetical protein [uncultured Anaerovibrio sp.]MBQ3854209.1 hypothetical protein [Anaerovibrio sp.]